MALAALRSSRSLGPLVRRLRPERRCIATATASPSAPAALDHDGPALSLPHQIDVTNRRQAIKQAKPFSDFLTDKYNRQHDYLRISVTERCNLRCLYCMPEEGVPLSPSSHLLTTPEIVYLSELFVSQGVTKIRLTGGEPTVRPDILPLMQQIGSLKSKGLRELALTTNAISLHRKLDKMVEAGLTGVNISLDTLDPFQFQILTRRKGYDAVMKSIDRVLEMNKLGAGVKLKMGREKDIEVRFIEYMPFGGNKWSERKMLTYQEMLDTIREKYPALRSVKGHLNDTSKTYEIPGFVGKIGFITSMTHNFCGTCNRLRITSDGSLKVCLHGNTEVSLRDLLRKDNDSNPMDEQAFRKPFDIVDLRSAVVCTIAFPNCQMDPFDTGTSTDLVVAEGSGLRGGIHNSKHRPMGSSRLGQAVPLHLLHSSTPSYHGARLYSSSTSSSLPPSPEKQTADDLQNDVTPSLLSAPTPNDGPESGFANAIVDTQPDRSIQETNSSDSPFDGDLFFSSAEEEEDEKAHEMLSSIPTIKAQQQPDPSSAEQLVDTNDAKVIRFKKASKDPKASRAIARDIEAAKIQPSALSSTPVTSIDAEQNEPSLAQHSASETDFLDSVVSTPTTPSSSLKKADTPNTATATTLTHLTSSGEAHMVDVGGKDFTERVAVAVGFVHFSNSEPYRLITQNLNKKGDVLGVARIAGIMAAKRCSDIIPLCHPIPITKITLNVGTLSPQTARPMRAPFMGGNLVIRHGVAAVEARVHTRGQTGVEMEALTAVSGACLTIYDMCKAVDKDMVISGARILYKEGGRSGTYVYKGLEKQSIGDRFINMDQDILSKEPQDEQ
ncbi:unnamed protein product [Aureobasidium mustum]|uniref:Radical SAM core domain-containing protein n=1 Tax=Aureobasidium mustum TaxID=2773714 RepID=A0A9N8JJA4_9PEZI|nr:unnamed protein product [Aureobasidium mustum]